MSIEEFYEANGVDDQIISSKRILFILPNKLFDYNGYLKKLNLDSKEVAITYVKKDKSFLVDEIKQFDFDLIIQLESEILKKYPVLSKKNISSIKKMVDKIIGVPFVNIHHHDEYSIRDGLGTVEGLVDLLGERKESFCVVTNHGNIGGWIKQYNICKKNNIKAIYGQEAYCNNFRGEDKEEKKSHRKNYHLIMLAKNETGFYNIIKIHNDAQLNGFYYKPRVNDEAMEKWGEGIIATSACMGGEIPRLLMNGKRKSARKRYEFYKKCFDEFYVELTLIEMKEQIEVNRRLIKFAKKVGAPLVTSLDSHYLKKEHTETHDILLLIKDHKTTKDKNENPEEVWQFDARNLYYRSADEVRDLWQNGFDTKDGEHYNYKDDVFTKDVFNEAVSNTRKIALGCDDIELDSKLKLPKLYKNANITLKNKVKSGFSKRKLRGKKYIDRINRELDVICKLGFSDYFLIVEKIVRDTKNEFGEWSLGFGRGSAGGSLVSYCLGITDIDPIKYGLYFERFLDEERTDPPDIDLDFDPRIRDWVKQHIVDLFGQENTCSIGTYVTYKTRAVIIDVARALALNVWDVMSVTKGIDSLAKFEVEDENQQIDKMSFDDVCKFYPELEEYFKSHPDVRKHAEVLRNQVKNMGKHAGGVIISNLNLQNRIPVFKGSDGNAISSWSEGLATHDLSEVGLVKFDILGLRNLSIISDCLKYIKQNKGIELTKSDIPINDKRAIKLGSKDLVGIFQFENYATKNMVDAIGMESIFDIGDITSLLRPGPKDMGMHDEYASRKRGEFYEMPDFLRELLKDTYGIVVYQEQCAMVAQVLGSFTPVESNKLRVAISKKKLEDLGKLRKKFIKGAQKWVKEGKITKQEVIDSFSLLESFGGYGFNKSHALEYSAITAAELWLKQNYFVEYMTAILNNTEAKKKKRQSDRNTLIEDYVGYLRRKGIKLLPPDINQSSSEFKIENGAVRFSLSYISHMGSSASNIVESQPYKSLEDFFNKVNKRKVNKRVVENMIYAGVFDCFKDGIDISEGRNELLVEYHKLRGKKKEVPRGMSKKDLVKKEREVLSGLVFSQPSIVMKYNKKAKKNKWHFIGDMISYSNINVVARIENIKSRTSKKGNDYLYVTISDDIDSKGIYVFSQQPFNNKLNEGYVASIPLKKFDEGDSWFFNDNGDIVVLEEN